MDEIVKELKKLIDIAYDQDEIPIAAVVVKNNQIIGRGYNQRLQTNDVTSHAEINAIKEAAEKLGDWRLNDCDIYVTLEPCNMCKETIKESRIRNAYYFVPKSSEKKGFNKTNISLLKNEENNEFINDYKIKLNSFFKLKCNR